jgi:hypothetical protein
MLPIDKRDDIRDLLVRQYEYFKYLYEQEQKRASSIVNGAKVYIAFLIFILGSIILKTISPEKILDLFTNSTINSEIRIIGIALIILSVATLITAVLFSILVLKVWSYDRLCDTIERFEHTLTMDNELEVLSKSISDFSIATNRNNRINNVRAQYLTYGLRYLIIGTLLSIFSIVALNILV